MIYLGVIILILLHYRNGNLLEQRPRDSFDRDFYGGIRIFFVTPGDACRNGIVSINNHTFISCQPKDNVRRWQRSIQAEYSRLEYLRLRNSTIPPTRDQAYLACYSREYLGNGALRVLFARVFWRHRFSPA